MADIAYLIERLVASGADPVAAACVVAEAFLLGKGEAPSTPQDTRSKAAIRQQNYRERNKSVTRDVTEKTAEERNAPSQDVTNHNENVTPLRSDATAISYLPSSLESLPEKEVSKKEPSTKKRNAPLRDDWTPSAHAFEVAEEHGVNVQIVEQIFRDYLKSSGKLYADYDAAFYNFLRNQRRFNGNGHGTSQNKSVAAVAKRWAEQFESQSGDRIESHPDAFFRLPQR